MIDAMKREVEERNASLLSRARDKTDLVKKLRFTVAMYTCGVSQNSISPRSEFRAGGSSSSYAAGQSYSSIIEVEPGKSGIEKIIFPGQVPLEKGNEFYAWFLMGELKVLESHPFSLDSKANRKVWVPRDCKGRERAYTIEKLGSEEVVARYIDRNFKL